MGNLPSQESKDSDRNRDLNFKMVEMYNLKQVYYFFRLHPITHMSSQLDRSQFNAVLGEKKHFKSLWRGLFDAIDQKRDNIIDFEEFLTFVKHLKRGDASERRLLCFRLLSHDGFIRKSDVQYIAKAFWDLEPKKKARSDPGRADKYLQLFAAVGQENEDKLSLQDFEAFCEARGEFVVNETLELAEALFDSAIDDTGIDITATDVVNTKPHIDWQDHHTMGSCLCCKSQYPTR